MKKLIGTIMLTLAVTLGVSAQQETEREPVAHLRGCRVGTPNPQFKSRRAPLLKGGITPGKHTLKVIMIDPEIVVEQIVVNPDNSHYSYFGNFMGSTPSSLAALRRGGF